MRTLCVGLLLVFGCGGEPEPTASADDGSPASVGDEEAGMSVDGERFLDIELDTQGVPHVSTDFGTERDWTISVGRAPEDESAREVVESTAVTVRALAEVDPIRPLSLGAMSGYQYLAHVEERGVPALACFGAADDPVAGVVVRVAYQTMNVAEGAERWDALTGSFGPRGAGEGQLVQLDGLRFRVPTDEGRLTLIHPDEEMTIRLQVTREPDPAAPLFEPGFERSIVDREDTPHPVSEGAMLSTFSVQGRDDRSTVAVLVAPLADGRTLVVHANDPNERWDAFLASLRVP